MKRKGSLRSILPDLPDDPDSIPFLPVVELAGDRRILVENHAGVIYYSTEKVGINVKYGELQVCGCSLALQQMTKIKLVILGRIDTITIIRRNSR